MVPSRQETLIEPPTIVFGGERPRGGTVEVDLPLLLETRGLMQGSSGSGKTHALYSLLQQTYGAVQHIIFDKEGEFPKLRERFDYLLVGPGGELPLDPSTIVVVLTKVLETRVNVIFDMSELAPLAQRDIVSRAFTYMAHLSIKSPLADGDRLVVLDEAQHFAREGGGGESVSREPVIELAALGRKRGFCLLCATTRVSHLSKGVTEILDNKLIGRSGQQDAKRAASELDFGKAELRELRSMPTGTFYAYGPAISVDPVLVRTASDLAVRPRKRGEKRATVATPAALRDVLGAFADVPEIAAEEAQTVDELRARVDDLTKRLRGAERGALQTRTVEVPVIDPEVVHRAAIDAVNLTTKAFIDRMRSNLDAMTSAPVISFDDLKVAITTAIGDRPLLAVANRQDNRLASVPPSEVRLRNEARSSTKVVNVTTDGARIGKSAQAMIDAIALCERLGNQEPKRDALAGLIGVSNPGTLRNVISELRRGGLIEDRYDERVALTAVGRKHAQQPAITTLREVHEMWMNRLGAKAKIVLGEIIRAHPTPSQRDYLQRYAGVENDGTFRNVLSEIRRLGLIDDVTSETVKGSAMLYPEGLK